MGKYLTPLWVFVGGNLCLLIAWLFMPAIGTAGTQLAADTANISSTFWNWTWVVGSVKLLVYVAFELVVLYSTAKAFLAVK